MKILILGHARHGKDTLADLLHTHYDVSFLPTSVIACTEIVYGNTKKSYPDEAACYKDRSNHRQEWFELISDYNKPASRFAKLILSRCDLYCGMRSLKEFNESKHLFDIIIWVDASERLPLEPSTSMQVTSACADIVVSNNGTLAELERSMKKLWVTMQKFQRVVEAPPEWTQEQALEAEIVAYTEELLEEETRESFWTRLGQAFLRLITKRS